MRYRFAILRFDKVERRTYLVAFVRADSTPHAVLLAYKRFGVRDDLFARGTKSPGWYQAAPGYSGHDNTLRW